MFRTMAEIAHLAAHEVWQEIAACAGRSTVVLAWVYLFDPQTLDKLTKAAGPNTICKLIADHRMRKPAEDFCRAHPLTEIATWSMNRTMHDKTMVFPGSGQAIIMTHNITRGSYYYSQNTAVRIDSQAFADHLTHIWLEHRSKARAVNKTSEKRGEI